MVPNVKQHPPFRKEVDNAVNRWELPAIEKTTSASGLNRGFARSSAPPTAAEIEIIQKQAWQEGFDQGYADGTSKGYKSGIGDAKEVVDSLYGILESLDKPVRLFNEQVMEELVAVIRAVARQLVRREIHQDPGQLIAVVREAVNALPFSSQQIQIRLHPEDAAVIREVLALDNNAPIWELIEDLALNRGDVHLVGDTSKVDGRLETRLNTLIAGMLGGVRQADEQAGEGSHEQKSSE